MNRYVMCYSQADGCNIIVFADTYEEAEAKFENGEFVLEDEEPTQDSTELTDRVVRVDWDTDGEDIVACGLPEEVSVPWFVPDEGVADYCSDIYGYCVNSWVEISDNKNCKRHDFETNQSPQPECDCRSHQDSP